MGTRIGSNELGEARTQGEAVARSAAPFLVIERTRGWGRLGLGEAWRARELLWFLTTLEIKGRYRQMALGPLWIVFKPVIDMVIFSLIFGGLAKLDSEGLPYPLFTFTAILPWTYFKNSASGAATSLVTRMGVISKVYFPRLLVPTAAILSNLVDLAITLIILLCMLIFYGVELTPLLLILPLYVVLAMATALGIGLWSAVLAVRFRDMRFAITYALQIATYATPVAYSAALIPERWQLLYRLNPMYWVIEGFRWALLGTGRGPEPLMLIPVAAVAVVLVTGVFVFRRFERNIVDLL